MVSGEPALELRVLEKKVYILCYLCSILLVYPEGFKSNDVHQLWAQKMKQKQETTALEDHE